MATLSTQAKHDHLQRVASTRDPVKAIAEFVWNSLDADSTKVSVYFSKNDLGGLEGITISDNGVGISQQHAIHDFESVGDSWKMNANSTPLHSRVIHGKEGKGRFRFYSLAHKAKWNTVYAENDSLYRLEIMISSSKLNIGEVNGPTLDTQAQETGTLVELFPLKETFDWLISENAKAEFNAILSPYILQYPNVEIIYDGCAVDPQRTIDREHEFKRIPIICPGRTVRDLSLKVIEWKLRYEGRKIYFGGESGIVLGSIPANITAPGFDFSVYAHSEFFQDLFEARLLEMDDLTDPDFSHLLEHIRSQVGDYFRIRQAEKSSELIQDLKDAGIYPYEGEPKDEVERRERQVFDIATHAVSSYSRDFKKADNSLKKITLSLLREAVGRNPESMSRILRAVFNLPKLRQDEFSNLLEKTELGHIISASTLISDRIVMLHVLRNIVFDPKLRRSIKERGELDVLIRDNTWIFGENFHITMSESGLSKIMERVSEDLSGKKRGRGKVRTASGRIGRVDSFMGRAVPNSDPNHREYLVVELKRPSTVVGRKELDQLEDYVNALIAQPDFKNTQTYWHFYLVSSEQDSEISARVTQKDRPPGLFLEGENYKVWAKSWSELIRDCEGRLKFVQEKLQIEVSNEEIERRIVRLQNSVLRAEESAAEDR